MSTSCLIGKMNEDGIMGKYIYCHFDGYPENILPILEKNYNTEEKVDELLDVGNISSLYADIEEVKKEAYEEPAGYFAFDFPREGQEFNYLFKKGGWICKEVY